MNYEPSIIEIFLTEMAFFFCKKSVYKAFADRLPLDGGENVLDFGCGMGTVACYAAKRLPTGQLTCLDISARWLRLCRKTLRKEENVVFLKSGPDAAVLRPEAFDVVYCHFVLHDIPGAALESVVAALVNALKTGGALVFREPLDEAERLSEIKRLIDKNGLTLKKSRVTDTPIMGNALESVYVKK